MIFYRILPTNILTRLIFFFFFNLKRDVKCVIIAFDLLRFDKTRRVDGVDLRHISSTFPECPCKSNTKMNIEIRIFLNDNDDRFLNV